MRPAGIEQVVRFFFRPQGRITRTEYLLGIGFILAVEAALLALMWDRIEIAPALLFVGLLPGLLLTIAVLVLIAKRCHDIGLPGSFLLLLFVPAVGLVWIIFLGLMPGKDLPNAYGPAPRFGPD
jgi:uncharacterized membrane protein YhaH (DUF805 family)